MGEAALGYVSYVPKNAGSCAFPLCSRQAVATFWLRVDGSESVMSICQRHVAWLRGYVDEDPAVRIVDEVSVEGELPAGRG